METTERLEYSEKMTALDGDSDFRRQLKPSALLRYVEQISADHARAHGMDYQFFQERHNAFLVAKTAVQITRRPVRSEEFTLTTACEVFRKGAMKRLTTLTDAEGNRLALVDCRWMLVDTQTGRILRGPAGRQKISRMSPSPKSCRSWSTRAKTCSRPESGRPATPSVI